MSAPLAPVFGNQTGAPFALDAQAIRAQLAAQIANPVRFVETIQAMYESGVRTFIEVGPSAVLTGLVTAGLVLARVLVELDEDRTVPPPRLAVPEREALATTFVVTMVFVGRCARTGLSQSA